MFGLCMHTVAIVRPTPPIWVQTVATVCSAIGAGQIAGLWVQTVASDGRQSVQCDGAADRHGPAWAGHSTQTDGEAYGVGHTPHCDGA
jgi:hypothetical protein